MTRQIKGGDEQDAYTEWRHLLARFNKAGRVKAVKRRTHKRERQEARRNIRNGEGNG